MPEDLPALYDEYLGRFATEVGDAKVGAFAKFNGRLIKKLSAEEFALAHGEYEKTIKRYATMIDRGDTINDVVLKRLREQATNLVLRTVHDQPQDDLSRDF